MNHDERIAVAKMIRKLEGDGQHFTGHALTCWFAGHAVFWIARDVEKEIGKFDPDIIAQRAFDFADRMLALAASLKEERLKKKQTEP